MIARRVGLSLALLGVSGMACSDKAELVEATPEAMASEVGERLEAIARCWTAGDKRGSHLTGEEQLLRISVQPTGKVKTAFADAAHNKHPVGSCTRSAFDGLRFAPRSAPTVIEVPLHLGASVQTPTAGTPTASQVASPAP